MSLGLKLTNNSVIDTLPELHLHLLNMGKRPTRREVDSLNKGGQNRYHDVDLSRRRPGGSTFKVEVVNRVEVGYWSQLLQVLGRSVEIFSKLNFHNVDVFMMKR